MTTQGLQESTGAKDAATYVAKGSDPWEVRFHPANPRMASVFGPQLKRAPEHEGGRWYTDPATARLIAAAPEMYAALVAIQEWLMFNHTLVHEKQFWNEPFVKANDLTVAAIAKATGAP